jgi:hypothetical protein
MFRFGFPVALLLAPLRAWDVDGHQIVNRLALASLPPEFPGFVRTPAAADRLAYLASAPDRWRNVDPWLKQSGSSWLDHFLDVEELAWAGLDARTVPSLRLDFALAFAAGRAAHPELFPAVDPAKNADGTRQWPGFAPWAIAEWSQKLRSAFSYLKAYEEVGGTPEEIANAQADAIYVMGILGHYIGDCAQPLHTTVHHNGWAGANPAGYTTWPGFHSWIDGKDGGLIGKARITLAGLAGRAAPVAPFPPGPRADGRDPFFVEAMDYILAQHALVEPLYRLEQEGKLGNGDRPVAPEGRAFIEGQLLKGGTMLARVWLTAWQSAPVDTYLRTQLGKRLNAAGAPVPPPPGANK